MTGMLRPDDIEVLLRQLPDGGQVDVATDGLLVLRYLLGMRGATLVNGALGPCPSRDTVAIEAYLAARTIP